jgi:muconate cycloisomerase
LKVRRIDILKVGLRLRGRFRHATFDRNVSENVIVRVHAAEDAVGHGEGVPREYVTGETADGAFQAIRELARQLIGRRWDSYESLWDELLVGPLRDFGADVPAARCALELALLDAGGRHFRRSVSSLLGESPRRRWVRYGVAISSDDLGSLEQRMRLYRRFGIRAVKVKLGADEADVARVALARRIMGRRALLGVDVNGVWSVDLALRRAHDLTAYGVRFIEEPTEPGNIDALVAVAARSPIPIAVDESLCSEADAERLIRHRACHSFNLRVSKCGGLAACVRLARLAERHGLGYSVGCHVGESGVLSAAGRHLIFGLGGVRYAEGSYGTFLLREDLTKPSVRFGLGGFSGGLRGEGLGVTVPSERLDRHLLQEERVG